MRNLSRTLSLLLLSAPLIAQAPATTTLALQAPARGECPVGFSARHAAGGGLQAVSPATKPQGQGYDLTFAPLAGEAARGIVQAKVTLHGLYGHQIVPVEGRSGANAAESFTLSPAAGPQARFTSFVYLGKLTGVTSVELKELTYADGTRWRESAAAPCQIAPNGYMLVASDR